MLTNDLNHILQIALQCIYAHTGKLCKNKCSPNSCLVAENFDMDEEILLKYATTLTNRQRGNEVTVRPATLDGKLAQAQTPFSDTVRIRFV